MQPIYLDNAATTPVAPEVRAAIEPWLGAEYGNPSSRHAPGVRARAALDRARRQVARAVGASGAVVTFTSGGTEANNLAVLGGARARRRAAASGRARIVVGPTEHPSVLAPAEALAREGFEVVHARVDATGALDLDSYTELCDEATVLVAQMLVNNEVGSLYPVAALARIVRARSPRALLHVDAVQSLGKVEVSFEDLGADTLSVSAHKLHAPKGTGALVRRAEVVLEPIVHGGGQEGGLRSGTENVAGIVGLGAAAEAADQHQLEAARSARAARAVLEGRIGELQGATLLRPGPSVDFVCPLRLPGPPAEVWQHHLEARGVLVSVGSACQSNSNEASPSLSALGLDGAAARQVMRFSFSRYTTEDEVERAMDALIALGRELSLGAR